MCSVIKQLLLLLIFLLIPTSLVYSQLLEKNDEEGFKQILTNKMVKEWDGNLEYWHFEDGTLIGELMEDSSLEHSTFYTWKKTVKDFELKVEYRISSKGNSGIYYRSTTTSNNRNVLIGYQADIDGANKYSGIIYENFQNREHKILVNRGSVVHVGRDDVPVSIGSIGNSDVLASEIKSDGWNEYHLIARGNTIIQILNGQVMSILIDDYKDRVTEGMLGVQLHQGPPMKVEFRNFRLKKFQSNK